MSLPRSLAFLFFTACAASAQPGLIAWYSFDRAGDPGHDEVSGYQGSPVNMTQVPGLVGTAASFVNGWLDLPVVPAFELRAGDFTFEVFVKGDPGSGNRNWFSKAAGSTHRYGLGGGSVAGFGFDGGAGGGSGGTTIIFDRQWHHVALVKRGATAELWVDGHVEATANVASTPDGGNLAIGRMGICCEFFNGLMDEAKIWNRALSPAELAAIASARSGLSGSFQIRYAANLNLGDAVVNLTNTGARGAGLASGTTASTTGAVCANIYAFSPDEQMISCCSCPVTPNGLASLSVREDLLTNTLTPAVPTSIVIKLLASVPSAEGCGAAAANVNAGNLAPGLLGWGTSVKAGATGPVLVETAFAPATLSAGAGSELTRLQQLCSFIQANGSGFGLCRSCRLGALGSGRR